MIESIFEHTRRHTCFQEQRSIDRVLSLQEHAIYLAADIGTCPLAFKARLNTADAKRLIQNHLTSYSRTKIFYIHKYYFIVVSLCDVGWGIQANFSNSCKTWNRCHSECCLLAEISRESQLEASKHNPSLEVGLMHPYHEQSTRLKENILNARLKKN